MPDRGYHWDARTGRYRGPDGHYVSRERMARLLSARMEESAQRMGAISGRLSRHTATLTEWHEAMKREIRDLHVTAAALGRGGWAEMDAQSRAWTAERIRSELTYLNNFAAQLASGEQSLDGRFVARSAMYASSPHATWQESWRSQRKGVGATEERNVMTAVENCGGCIEQTERGWVAVGMLTPIGQRDCLSNCRCYYEMR